MQSSFSLGGFNCQPFMLVGAHPCDLLSISGVSAANPSCWLVLTSAVIFLSSGGSTANLSCWLMLIRCDLLSLSGVSAAIHSRSRVLFCCDFLSISSGFSCHSFAFTGTSLLWAGLSFTSSLSSVPGTITLPPLSQTFAPLFRCLCSTSSSISFVSAPSPIFLLLCWFESSSKVAVGIHV